MKILIATDCYYPQKNGVQAVTQYQAEGLAQKGHEVTVITTKVDEANEEEIHNGVSVVRYNIYNKLGFHRGDKEGYQKKLLELCEKVDVFVSVTTQSAVTDWSLSILSKIKCAKFLYMHGMQDFKWKRSDFISFKTFAIKIYKDLRWRWYYVYNKKNLREFDVTSHLHRYDTAYKFFEKNKLGNNVVLMNAADDEFFYASKEIIDGLPKNYIIHVSNYHVRKNQELALKSFYEVNTSDFGLVFIGSVKNKYCNKLIKLKDEYDKRYGEKDVRILYNIPRKDVSTYVKNAKLATLSSTWEAFPISLIEPMASSIPFVATDVGVVKYLPGGVSTNNNSYFKYWLELFINDAEIREAYGNIAYNYAYKELRTDIQNDRFERFLRKIVENHKQGE